MPLPTLETAPASAGQPARMPAADLGRGWTCHPHLQFPRLRAGVASASATIADKWAWRRKIRQDPRKAFFYRIAVGVLGALMIIAAPILGPLPGPGGIPLVLLGLAVWSSEFSWAKRLAVWFKAKVAQYRQLSRTRKVFIVLGIFAIIWAVWYVGLIIVGVPGWVPEAIAGYLNYLPGVV